MNAILMAAVIFSGNLIGGTQVQLTDKQQLQHVTCEVGHVAVIKRYQRQNRALCWLEVGDNVRLYSPTEPEVFTDMPKAAFNAVDEV